MNNNKQKTEFAVDATNCRVAPHHHHHRRHPAQQQQQANNNPQQQQRPPQQHQQPWQQKQSKLQRQQNELLALQQGLHGHTQHDSETPIDIEDQIAASYVPVPSRNPSSRAPQLTSSGNTQPLQQQQQQQQTGKEPTGGLHKESLHLASSGGNNERFVTQDPAQHHHHHNNNKHHCKENEEDATATTSTTSTSTATSAKREQHGGTKRQESASGRQQSATSARYAPPTLHLAPATVAAAMNSGQPTQATSHGNRITFTSQPLPNGTINIGAGHTGGGPTIISTSHLPNTTTIKTINTGGGGAGGGTATHHGMPQQVQVQHHQVLQAAGPQGTVVGQQQQQQQQHNAQSGNQPMINSMIPASVVVGMRPPGATQQQQTGKSVQGSTLGRVVIGGPHMVNTRPQSPAITLGALAPGQTPALIVKTETGFQLLRVGTATSGPVTQTIGTNSNNPTQIRLQTVPAANMATSSPNIVNSVASTNPAPLIYTSQANISLQQQPTQNVIQPRLQQQQQQQQPGQLQHHTQQTQHLNLQPQITAVQTIQPQQLTGQQQSAGVATVISSSSGGGGTMTTTSTATAGGTSTTPTTAASTTSQGNTKEKCRKFLANLIDLSTREPKPVEKNVRNLIQELVNANVEPEEFCDRLERLLNASPQPCLIGFLKKSLPLLRQALYSKELIIEGIRAPPQSVVNMTNMQQLPRIQAQIRPISQNQTATIGQTQVRMISPSSTTTATGSPRLINNTLAKPQAGSGIRIQVPTTPRLVNAQIRGGLPVGMQQAGGQLPTAPQNIVQIRTQNTAPGQRPANLQVRAKGKATAGGGGLTQVKVGQTQIKAIPSTAVSTSSQPPPLLATLSNNNNNSSLPTPPLSSSTISSSSSILSTINSVASGPGGAANGQLLPTVPSLSVVQLPTAPADGKAAAADSGKAAAAAGTTFVTAASRLAAAKQSPLPTKPGSKKKRDDGGGKDEGGGGGVKANSTAASAAASAAAFFQPSISMSSSLYGDDDINDVAAMGGVNLAEESQRILGSTENIGTQIRSCKDEVFLHLPALQARIRAMVTERGLEDASPDVAVLISHACQERLKNIVEELAVIAEHRIDVIKLDPRYEVTRDVRGQIKFLEELDKAEQKRHEEMEREMLLRAAKSRSKIEDPEQAKMKARAKEMQRAEMEELRQRDANMTALQAIGPRKKPKLDGDASGSGVASGASGTLGASGSAPAPLRPRIKRINLRDMQFFMEQDRFLRRSQLLYKSYLK